MTVSTKINRVSIHEAKPVGEHVYTFNVEIDQDKCTGCGVCAIECPSRILEMRPASFDCKPNCAKACLAGNDVRAALNAVRDGASYADAWKLITNVNPLPGCVGRACTHPCEDHCSREHLDKAVNLHEFERFVGDFGIENGLAYECSGEKIGKKVAVVGGGASGLSCAYHLARSGCDVTIFEAKEKLGGMLRYGIPEYRVPNDIIDGEVQKILDLGVEAVTGKTVGKDVLLNDLKKDFDAIYLAFGTYKEMRLGVENEAEITKTALSLLNDASRKEIGSLGDTVVVIGGGNVAMDAARTVKRLGAGAVKIVSLEQRYEMPAWKSDIAEALDEGIEIVNGWGVKDVKGTDKKTVILKRCVSVFDENHRFSPKYDEDDNMTLEVDAVVCAVGQRPDTGALARDGGVSTQGPFIGITDDVTCKTNVIGIFAGGDATRHSHAGSVAGSIGMGRRAADSILGFLGGELFSTPAYVPSADEIGQEKYNSVVKRNEAPEMAAADRTKDLSCEIFSTFKADEVKAEVDRCLACCTGKAHYIGPQNARAFNWACNNCHNCVDVCSEKAITFNYTTLGKNSKFDFSD